MTRTGLAVAAAVATGLAGAAVWAGAGFGTGRMFWMLAIVIGVGVGIATSKAAGKGGPFVQCVSVIVAMFAVLARSILMNACHVNQEAGEEGAMIDRAAFAAAIPATLVETGSDTAFAVGGGLIGAFCAARATGRKKFAVKLE
jgi:hypothetical protein